jgi:glycosyltransferase involved in cell wall biosynthesis
MSLPRIAFLNGSGQPGGAEVALAELARAVPGAEIVLFQEGGAVELLRSRGLAVSIEALNRKALSNSKESGIPGPGLVLAVLRHAWRLSRLLRGYDLVHCNNQKAWVVGAFASALARRPVVWHLHDILSDEHFSRSKIRLGIALSRWRRAKVVANSRASAEAFVRAGGRADRVEVLHVPVDPGPLERGHALADLRSSIGCPEGEPLWAIFSRLAEWKGQHVAIEALSLVPRGHLLLVGAPFFGEERWERKLREQVERLGLGGRVHFLGFRKDIPDLLATVDGTIHSSIAAEPFGLVILEAQLAGRPVVATAAGGALEIVQPGIDGWLVPPGEVEALASVLRSWMEDPQAARAIGAAAASEARKRFDRDRILDRFRAILVEEARST